MTTLISPNIVAQSFSLLKKTGSKIHFCKSAATTVSAAHPCPRCSTCVGTQETLFVLLIYHVGVRCFSLNEGGA